MAEASNEALANALEYWVKVAERTSEAVFRENSAAFARAKLSAGETGVAHHLAVRVACSFLLNASINRELVRPGMLAQVIAEAWTASHNILSRAVADGVLLDSEVSSQSEEEARNN